MNIQWYGQACFRIETRSTGSGQAKEDVSVLIDPFSKEIGLRTPRIKDDLVLVTHEHYDHNNLENINEEAFVVSHPGEYERKGIYVRGISSYHDNAMGAERGLNTIYVIKADDIILCHLGDLGQDKLDEAQVEAIGGVDILFIPVGGTYTIDGKVAAQIATQIEPKIVIPMHYKVPGLEINLDTADKFVREIGLVAEKTDKFRITKKLLPAEETKLVMFVI